MSRLLFSSNSLVTDSAAAPASSVLALDTAGRLECDLVSIINYLDDSFRHDARTAFLLRSIETVVVTARLLRQYVLEVMCRLKHPLI